MAQSTRDIKRRMQSIDSTRQITKAMEMIASTKLRKAQKRVEQSRPYLERLEDTLSRVTQAARKEGDELPIMAQQRSGDRRCLVIVTADRGLAGGYNANILRRADQYLREHDDVQLILIGRKARDYYRRRNRRFLAEYVNIGEDVDFRQAQEVSSVIEEFFANELFDRVDIVFNYFINSVSQRVKIRQILPIPEPQEEAEVKHGPKALYWFEPSFSGVLNTLVPQYVETCVFQSLLEATASEQGARMSAMRSATDNATDLIKQLTLSFNRARQAAITTEISEIVGGAEALQS